jgi:hypothetical protein
VNVSEKYFTVVTLTYTNELIARELGREFLKGLSTGTVIDIGITVADNIIQMVIQMVVGA